MILYMAPVSAEAQMNVSPEEMNKGMEPWMAWFKKCEKAIVDQGAATRQRRMFRQEGKRKGSDAGDRL